MVVQFLSEVASNYDMTNVFTLVTNGVKSVIGLVSEYPLNIFLGASVIGIGIGIYQGLKH